MENKFELEEMKQQWSTLQTALNNQKEVNIKLILKDAKKHVSWNKGLLRAAFFVTLFFSAPAILCILHYLGVPQPIYITLTLLLVAAALNALYISRIVQTPNDSNIDIVKYGKSLVKFKKHYLWSEAFGCLSIIAIITCIVLYTEFDMSNPMILGGTIGGTIGVIVGAIIGISLSLKVLANIKELQSDIDLIEDIQE